MPQPAISSAAARRQRLRRARLPAIQKDEVFFKTVAGGYLEAEEIGNVACANRQLLASHRWFRRAVAVRPRGEEVVQDRRRAALSSVLFLGEGRRRIDDIHEVFRHAP